MPKVFYTIFIYFCLIMFYLLFNKTDLFEAVESENIELVRLLLTNQKIDVNLHSALKLNYFNEIL